MTEDLKNNFENEEKIDESIIDRVNSLKEAKEKEEEKEKKIEEVDVEKSVLEIIGQLPKDLRSAVQAQYEKLKSWGLPEKKRLKEIKEEVEKIKTSYEDKRFEIPNGNWMRLVIKHLVDDLVSKEMDLIKIKGLGIINFDLDGLKSVNYIAGHEQGTEYLRRVVEVFKNGQTTKALESRGIRVDFSSDGGDEFIIVLSDDVNLTEVESGQIYIDKILESYKKEIHSVDVTDIVDFKKSEVVEKFDGMEIPKGFKFTTNISGGTTTFKEVLENIKGDGSNYSDQLNEITSDLFTVSGKREEADKEAFKDGIAESADEYKHFLSIVLLRNEETRKAELKNKKLKEENAEKGDKIKKLEEELAEIKRRLAELEK